jgi:hypothetical protein
LRPEDTHPRTWQHATTAETAALYRAVMLAPTLEVCEALLRHEKVPLHKLDPVWVRRLGA